MTNRQTEELRTELVFLLRKIDSDVICNLNDEDLLLLEDARELLEREAEPYL
jgi:hypothetical protein